MLNLLAGVVTTGLQRVNHHTILQREGITGLLHTCQKFKISNKKNTSVGKIETSDGCLEVSWLMAIIALRQRAGEDPDNRR